MKMYDAFVHVCSYLGWQFWVVEIICFWLIGISAFGIWWNVDNSGE